ncbi:hypothetical protein ACQUSR_05805 [Streptomyces sp. P1-3]|uniref:hypothetical protein n=1 Tax=Streptomyces sp. P1-3 TaxID=3421658 RepID=UPI003D368A87
MSTPETPPNEQVVTNVRVDWEQPTTAAVPANQFATTVGLPAADGKPDGIYLTIGILEPPFLTGSPDEMQKQLQGLENVTTRLLGRYVLTRARLAELINLLQVAAKKYDAVSERGLNDDGGPAE